MDLQDAAVPGATVRLSGIATDTVVSDDDGRFEFRGLISASYFVEAWTETAAASPRRVALEDDSGPIVLRVFGSAALTVSVLASEDNQPLAEATVDILPPVKQGDEPLRSGSTDREGQVRFRGLSPGSYFLVASAPGRTALLQPVPPQAGLDWSFTVKLATGAAVSGRVLSARGGPIEGAFISPMPAALQGALMPRVPRTARNVTLTNRNGEFSVAAVERGQFFLRVSHADYLSSDSVIATSDGATPITGLTITLEPGGSITGQVVDASGAGQPGAVVRVNAADPTAPGAMQRQELTDENGRFAIAGLIPAMVELVAQTPTATSNNEAFDLGESPEVKDVVIRLDHSGVVRGVISDATGNPIADAEVVCVGRMVGTVGVRPVMPETTDSDGRFACAGLFPGEYYLTARRPYPNNNQSPWMRSAGAVAQTGEEVAIILPGDGGVMALVQRADGSIASEFEVVVDRGGRGRRFHSEDGRFVLDGLAPRRYSLEIKAGDQSLTTDVLVPEGGNADLGTLVLSNR